MAANVADSEPPVLIEIEVVEEPELKVEDPKPKAEVEEPKAEVEEPKAEVEEHLIETPIDLPAEPTMKLLSFSLATRFPSSLRSPDVYDPYQIFLQEICSREVGTLVCGLVFSGTELPCYDAPLV